MKMATLAARRMSRALILRAATTSMGVSATSTSAVVGLSRCVRSYSTLHRSKPQQTRAFLQQQRHVSNVSSLIQENGLYFVSKRGMSTFKRTKPHVNIGTIGHVDHGMYSPFFLLTTP